MPRLLWLDEQQKGLRLRAHARSLGDALHDDIQATDPLVAEIAYEHWYRILLSRFLAGNDLLHV